MLVGVHSVVQLEGALFVAPIVGCGVGVGAVPGSPGPVGGHGYGEGRWGLLREGAYSWCFLFVCYEMLWGRGNTVYVFCQLL